jgi:hypothetical protein
MCVSSLAGKFVKCNKALLIYHVESEMSFSSRAHNECVYYVKEYYIVLHILLIKWMPCHFLVQLNKIQICLICNYFSIFMNRNAGKFQLASAKVQMAC